MMRPGRAALAALALATAACASAPVPVAGLRPAPAPTSDAFTSVASRSPVLHWQAFPRRIDVAADPRLAGATSVRYDLRIWRADDERPHEPAELVYTRDGLPEPGHAVTIVLAPRTRYLWTVRARFELDEQTRVTPWSARLVEASPPVPGGFQPPTTPLYDPRWVLVSGGPWFRFVTPER